MSFLSLEELKELVEQPQGLCISMYMPTVQMGSDTFHGGTKTFYVISQLGTGFFYQIEPLSQARRHSYMHKNGVAKSF